jgi:integrative and conjugative element protein (TIGR02256 family)
MSSLQSELERSGVLWLSSKVRSFLEAEADAKCPEESGGVLLGYWAGEPACPVVTQAVGPGPKAIHDRCWFIPDYEFHEREVSRLYSDSKGTLQYMGDWHSHPGVSGRLSKKDRSTLLRIAKARAARAPRPLMLILGYGPEWELFGWSLGTQSSRFSFCRRRTIERWDIVEF